MVNKAGPLARGPCFTEDEADARGARVDDAMHALGTAMKALGRATAHRSLLSAIAIQPRHNRVGDLLN
jgi:hypothetical protein